MRFNLNPFEKEIVRSDDTQVLVATLKHRAGHHVMKGCAIVCPLVDILLAPTT